MAVFKERDTAGLPETLLVHRIGRDHAAAEVARRQMEYRTVVAGYAVGEQVVRARRRLRTGRARAAGR